MRRAYGGRAAAYEKRGDLDRAAADYGTVVFSYVVEADLTDPKADGYNDLLRDAAKAYRKRAACLSAKGDKEVSARDLAHADALEAKAKKGQTAEAPAQSVMLRNDWTDALTVVVGEARYTLKVGEWKAIPAPARSFAYQMQAGPYTVQGTFNAGRTYSLGVHPPAP